MSGALARRRAVPWAVGAALALGSGGCGGRPASAPGPAASTSDAPRVEFSFPTPDGGAFTSAAARGRATAVVFVTTYDAASQVLAQRIADLARRMRPRINACAVVLEAPRYAPLVQVFGETLRLGYPVALADEATRRGDGPFGRVDRVPVVVVLDRAGRERWRHAGLVSTRRLERALANAAEQGLGSRP
ncbi:MAG: TlpA family protein disulfide reductase [Polyangiaceae bacterium]|nr:TlpA family protein disulfide reductase [Polyangiaceae bacterium]